MARKKKDLKFFWEAPFEGAKDILDEPMEFRLDSPKIAFPEIKVERTIPVHMTETDSDVVVLAELPGFSKGDINLNVTESYVEIAAAKKEERVKRTEHAFVQERKAGAVRHAFLLPAKIDPDKTEAKLENGVLTIVMPKLHQEQKKKRRVDIK